MTFFIKSTLIKSGILSLCLALTACGKDRPTANILDTPLEKPLEIIIEPKKVAMTNTWALGVKNDGTLWRWGGLSGPTPKLVPSMNDVVAVSGGSGHALILKQDGTVWGWGMNYDGVIDPVNTKGWENLDIKEPKKIEGLTDIVDISAGDNKSFFINKQGEVYAIGSNKQGSMNGINEPLRAPIKLANLKGIVAIYNEGGIVLALNDKGEVYTTGSSVGSLGREVIRSTNKEINYYPAEKVTLPRKAVDIAVTGIGCMALLDNGEVWVWGNSSLAGLGLPKGQAPDLPIKHPYLNRIVNIGDRSAVDVEGNLYIWGEIGYGSYNAPSTTIYRTPIKIAENMNNPALLVNGNDASGVLTKDGELYAWGWSSGMIGTGEFRQGQASRDDVLKVQKSLFTTH